MAVFVLVGGWPDSGKTTLARALAAELGVACLSEDDVKEALMDRLGASRDVAESRRLGGAAVAAVLRAARGCPGAVIDSTWYPYSLPWVRELPGQVVEVRCRAPLEVVRERYRARRRDARHLDGDRTDDELWGGEVAPLGVGPLLEVDTGEPVDVALLADRIGAATAAPRP